MHAATGKATTLCNTSTMQQMLVAASLCPRGLKAYCSETPIDDSRFRFDRVHLPQTASTPLLAYKQTTTTITTRGISCCCRAKIKTQWRRTSRKIRMSSYVINLGRQTSFLTSHEATQGSIMATYWQSCRQDHDGARQECLTSVHWCLN